MSAVLNLAEETKLDKVKQNASLEGTLIESRNQQLLKKSVLLEGMVNPNNHPTLRRAVLKATDADTGKSIGRIQARQADEVSKRERCFIHFPAVWNMINISNSGKALFEGFLIVF